MSDSQTLRFHRSGKFRKNVDNQLWGLTFYLAKLRGYFKKKRLPSVITILSNTKKRLKVIYFGIPALPKKG